MTGPVIKLMSEFLALRKLQWQCSGMTLLSRETADGLELEPGVIAIAVVKSTNVSVEIPGSR